MRIAIVNDSATAREALRRLVLSQPGHSVAWLAVDGAEAVRRAAEDRPDVILMDLVMPVMDGVEATRRIMAECPCPILLVTASVTANFPRVYEAMGHGGLDAVNTPVIGPDGKIKDADALLARLAKVARAHQPAAYVPGDEKAHPGAPAPVAAPPFLALGASTGGPAALAQVLQALPVGFGAAVVVVQHIGAEFAGGLVAWLQGHTRLPVRLAREGTVPEVGEVLVAGTDDHLILRPELRLGHTAEPRACPYHPSIDVFYASLAEHWPRPGVAVLLTGMGTDGARGLGQLRRAGWLTIAQDEETSVVYGMPKAALEQGAACKVLPLGEIGRAAVEGVGTGARR